MIHELDLEAFKGPIETLLELIESKKLPVTEISLAEITADFLKRVEKLNGDLPESDTGAGQSEYGASPRLLADFLVVAAQLLLIKSRILLPTMELTAEEEEGIKDLEIRLEILRRVKHLGGNINALWLDRNIEFSRPLFKDLPVVFYPGKNLTREKLKKALESLFEAIRVEARETRTIKNTLISLEEKMQEVVRRLTQASKEGLRFGHFTDKKSKEEVVVLFLALLHLLQRRLVNIEQQGNFHEMVVRGE